jgi:ATP-dependent Clp protease ATP-binding subunit ClpA
MLRVAEILLEETAENLARQRVTLTFDEAVPAWLLSRCGVDPQAGARPLRRLVKLWVEDAVADFLILNRDEEDVELRMIVEGGRPVVKTWKKDTVTHGQEAG